MMIEPYQTVVICLCIKEPTRQADPLKKDQEDVLHIPALRRFNMWTDPLFSFNSSVLISLVLEFHIFS